MTDETIGIIGEAWQKRFQLVSRFKIKVPPLYDHRYCLEFFHANHQHNFPVWNDNITDPNFNRVTNVLVPGEAFGVKLFAPLAPEKPEDCLLFLQGQGAVFFGAQGLALLYNEAKDKIPRDQWLASLDREEGLYLGNDKRRRFPDLFCHATGWSGFGLRYFHRPISPRILLVCFHELTADERTDVLTLTEQREPIPA